MKTALITGTSRGIGKATAEKFLAEGWQVIGTSTSGKVTIDSKNFKTLKLNLTSPLSISGAAKKVGVKIDVLVNNAGTLEDFDDKTLIIKKLRKTLEVNLIGLADFTNRIIPRMKKGGNIINISSSVSSLMEPLLAHGSFASSYKISKTALNMYTQVLSGILKKSGIKVSSLDPGWVKTDMGGYEAESLPKEPAEDIFKLATRKSLPTGKFWYKGKQRSW